MSTLRGGSRCPQRDGNKWWRSRVDLAAVRALLAFSANAMRLAVAAIALIAISSHAAEVIPPKPAGYFNDYANVVSKEAALRFNEQLAQFERETSNQIWVVVYPKMQSDSS